MTKVDCYFLVLIKILLKWYGLWPYQSEIGRKLIFFVHILSTLSLIFALAGGLTEEWSTRANVIYENIVCITYLTGATFKYTILYLKMNQIKPLCDQFLSDYNPEANDEEEKLLNAYISKGLLTARILLVYGAPTFLLVGGLTFYWSSEDFVEIDYEEYFPYYYHKMIIIDRYYYPLIVIHVTIVFINVNMCYFMTCALIVILTTHACGVFTIAHHRLINVTEFPDKNLKKSDHKSYEMGHHRKVISNLVNVINKHSEAIKNVKQIDFTFNSVIGTVQIAALVCFGIVMYDVLYHAGTKQQLLRSIILLSIFIFYVYVLNWTGQEVLNVCDAFFMSSYSIEWYNMPLAAQQLLIIIQQRASKSEMLTAAFIFILSLNNFSWILKNSWAVTAVLLSTQNKMNVKPK